MPCQPAAHRPDGPDPVSSFWIGAVAQEHDSEIDRARTKRSDHDLNGVIRNAPISPVSRAALPSTVLQRDNSSTSRARACPLPKTCSMNFGTTETCKSGSVIDKAAIGRQL